jgi:hypothetical protein
MVTSPFASVKGVFDFPCPCRGWVVTLMAPSFVIQRVFTIGGVAMVTPPFASVKGVFDVPSPRRGWVVMLMAPSFGIQQVFTIVNM